MAKRSRAVGDQPRTRHEVLETLQRRLGGDMPTQLSSELEEEAAAAAKEAFERHFKGRLGLPEKKMTRAAVA